MAYDISLDEFLKPFKGCYLRKAPKPHNLQSTPYNRSTSARLLRGLSAFPFLPTPFPPSPRAENVSSPNAPRQESC